MDFPRFAPVHDLGRTGFRATALGIGDLADRSIPADDLVAWLQALLEAGLNVIDTAPGYEGGYSEEVVGQALQGGRREGVFLVDKIDFLDQPVAPQLQASLSRLRLGAIDLAVFHAVSTVAQWDALSAPGGPFDELRRCVAQGDVRFMGISCHHPEVLLRAIPSGLCDVVLFPIGPAVDPRYTHAVLPLAKEHRVGTICFKTFGAGKLLGDTSGYGAPLRSRPRGKVGSHGTAIEQAELPRLTVEQCLRYTLTRRPDVALLGLSLPNEQAAALAAASAFEPLTSAELLDIEIAAALAIEGKGPRHWDPPVGGVAPAPPIVVEDQRTFNRLVLGPG
jgi:aryl-alcohol dehydrogenase-like predicted oxidoreductase